jgi:hypothetical protein
MNLDMLVSRGLPPWRPSSEADEVEVWHHYDFPMAGTYEIQGRPVLYTLVGDTAQTVSVWAYIPISDAELAEMNATVFESPDQMMQLIQRKFEGKEAVFVLARNLRVWVWTRHLVSHEDGMLGAAATALAAMVRSITEGRKNRSPDSLFRAELAQAEVALDDLVDA